MKRAYTDSIHWWYNQYVTSLQRTAAPNTWRRYHYALADFFQRHKEKHRSEDFHRWDITDYKEDRLREGIAPTTVNLELRILRAFWNWLIERELASYNPAAKQKGVKVPEKRPRGLGRDVVDKLLSVCISVRDKLIILLPLTTGMRGIELARLQWIDIDWENNLIHLDGERTKTGKSRSLPLRDDVKKLLTEYMAKRVYVFPSRTGDPRKLQTAFNGIVKRAELYPKPTLHALRHTFATLLLRSGLDIYSVQKLMGHTQISTTTIYLTPADSDTVRNKINDFPALA